MQLVGDVSGKNCIIVDDMIDTGGTLCKAAELLRQSGATDVIACATHGLFNSPAIDTINKSVLSEVCVTDSIPQDKNVALCSKLKVISLVPLLSEAIYRLHCEKSLSALFEEHEGYNLSDSIKFVFSFFLILLCVNNILTNACLIVNLTQFTSFNNK